MFPSQPWGESPHDPAPTRRLADRPRTALAAAAGCLASIAAAAALGPAPAASAADFGGAFSQTFAVTTLADSGAGSLRAAITAADAAPGTSFDITFSVAGTITLHSALPAVTRDVTIDGTTAPGYASGGPPKVEIQCDGNGGLDFAAASADSQLLAVAVDDASGNGVTLNADSITLNDDYIGLNLAGRADGNQGNGIFVAADSSSDSIGLNSSGDCGAVANVISGNARSGLVLSGSSGDTLAANRIGTNAAGDGTKVQGNFFGVGANNTAAVGNGLNGIEVNGSSKVTLVGGVIPLGNVSGDNKLNGIDVAGTASYFTTFNTFGGLLAFKGAAPNGNDGLIVTSTGGHNLARTNVFSGNARNGIELSGDARGVTVDPNIIGLTTKGNAVLANGNDGVLIDGSAHDNTIGGDTASVIPQNTFSGNRGYGLVMMGSAYDNSVFSTFIGTNVAGLAALGNAKGGVLISGHANRNSIGNTGKPPVNLISGNTSSGVWLARGSIRNRVIDNYIGLSRFGKPLRNSGKPVVNDGHLNVVRGNVT
jgi:hypothetical protein